MAAVSWIVVADGARARIFSAGTRDGGIAEVADLVNPGAKERDDDIASYSGGEGRPGARTSTQEKSAVEHANERFSKYLSGYLEAARNQHRYERVYLVASPKFLGRLRQDLSEATRKLVAEELDKDISWFNPRELELYVKKKL
jgi:protein required for attachment to host cells